MESQANIVLDINEDDINKIEKDLLSILLMDRTTKNNILWGTDDYTELGDDYSAEKEIK